MAEALACEVDGGGVRGLSVVAGCAEGEPATETGWEAGFETQFLLLQIG